MRLRNGRPCWCEDVDVTTLVPLCPSCRCPLAASTDDPDHGFCSNKYEGGVCNIDRMVIPPDEWEWGYRCEWNGADLPPANGWRPIDVEAAEQWLTARHLREDAL